jgi:hypothetical protein
MSKRTEDQQQNLADEVAEAQFNYAYWKRQAITRETQPSIAEAKALAAVWKTTLAARAAKLHPTATR